MVFKSKFNGKVLVENNKVNSLWQLKVVKMNSILKYNKTFEIYY